MAFPEGLEPHAHCRCGGMLHHRCERQALSRFLIAINVHEPWTQESRGNRIDREAGPGPCIRDARLRNYGSRGVVETVVGSDAEGTQQILLHDFGYRRE